MSITVREASAQAGQRKPKSVPLPGRYAARTNTLPGKQEIPSSSKSGKHLMTQERFYQLTRISPVTWIG